MKKGPSYKGGPEKAQSSKPHEKNICAKSSPPASTKSPWRLPPEILSAVARSGHRPITLARSPTRLPPDVPPRKRMDITWAIAALVRSIADTAPKEVVAELNPAALIKLARDAEIASAWLGALQVLAESEAKRAPNHPAGNGGAPLPQLDLLTHGGCK